MTDLVELLTELVACDSTNPSLSPGGAGESAAAAIVERELRTVGLDVRSWEPLAGRRSVLGRLPGAGDGPTLLLLGHLDVVAGDPSQFEPRIAGGRLFGRGACDMKGGLAASLAAIRELADGPRLHGDVVIAGVIDEEWLSAGAEDLLTVLGSDGLAVSGAILPEPTGLDLVVEHGGFAWFELTATGAEAAGDDPASGIDAIAHIGAALTGLLELDAELTERPAPAYGRPCLHASTIVGGTQLSAYPGSCTVGIERCTVPGETIADVRSELERLLARVNGDRPAAPISLRQIVGREAVSLGRGEPIVAALADAAEAVLGTVPVLRGDMGWMDSGVLVQAGIPCVAFGPTGDGEHTGDEWVQLESVQRCAQALSAAARRFCDAPCRG